MMFVRISAVAVLALFAAGSVQAADLIVDDAAVAAATTGVDWSGAYIGAHVGAAAANVDWEVVGGGPSDSYDISGGLLGAQIGYNWQNGNIVYGVEGDVSLSGVTGEDEDLPFISRDINWTASLRGRIGYSVDSLLIYGTAGLAVANSTGTLFVTGPTETHVGWTIGAGVEAMLADNVSAKVEYAYSDYGTQTYNYFGGGLPVDVSLQSNSLTVGVNFHF